MEMTPYRLRGLPDPVLPFFEAGVYFHGDSTSMSMEEQVEAVRILTPLAWMCGCFDEWTSEVAVL